MKHLEENEEYLDKIATETMICYIQSKPPQSQEDSIHIATIAYKQALAMLEIKLNLETVLNQTKFLTKQRIEEKKN